MPYPFDQIFAADPDNTDLVASNASVLIFAPGDAAKTPLALKTIAGLPLPNPVPVNERGFGPAFIADLDQVAWEGGGFSGLLVSYKGLKDEAVRAANAAEAPADEAVDRGIQRANIPEIAARIVSDDPTVISSAAGMAQSTVGLVLASDRRLPVFDNNVGLSFASLDASGNRTRLEANDRDGGPTEHSLSLDGPALRDYMDFVTGDDERAPQRRELPGVSLATTDAEGNLLWMQANDVDGGPTPFTVDILRKALALPTSAPAAIITDGDSITQGGHGGGESWQTFLSRLMGGAPITNSGISGTTALEIAIRQGGIIPILTLPDGQLPATTAEVPVQLDNLPTAESYYSEPTQPARTYRGRFGGVPAILKRNQDNTWTIARIASGVQVKPLPRTPFLVDTLPQGATRILWPGRNDYPKSQVRGPIDNMVRWVKDGGGRFLILSILTRSGEPASYNDAKSVIEQNRITQDSYPYNYVNVRDFLVWEGLQAAGVTPTSEDIAAQTNNAIPPSLMADGLHPNEAGRRAIAACLYRELQIRDWL